MKVEDYIKRMKEEAWDSDAEKEWIDMQKHSKVVDKVKERIIYIRHQLDHTEPDYKRSISLQESLQEMVNVLGFDEYEKIMVERED